MKLKSPKFLSIVSSYTSLSSSELSTLIGYIQSKQNQLFYSSTTSANLQLDATKIRKFFHFGVSNQVFLHYTVPVVEQFPEEDYAEIGFLTTKDFKIPSDDSCEEDTMYIPPEDLEVFSGYKLIEVE